MDTQQSPLNSGSFVATLFRTKLAIAVMLILVVLLVLITYTYIQNNF